ncbi:prepilin-type N-terminal cleavage/methylation domain-containing protein [Sporolactobacillus sp. CPB3-1]|uniref:Prepilin-type N-terminal cleavage/methylation domain-containing protein n=1 Tax=Sporolactobacillus mangiferae TaxID=2940498 RepID=A0ABT0M688_9BACL|nr:competence type IV pilus minor pilin ComGD [Sporolactobacillus mangiferae]MCL1630375.1 prepilin-type N-terminal cleavage/methylation domain-containing protein [Sporolactobacillus mangiferae]
MSTTIQPVKSVPHKKYCNSQNGFTLIEVLIVVLIACIIVPISFRGFSHLTDEMTLRNFVNELYETVHDTQMEAITGCDVARIVFNNQEHFYYVSINNQTTRKTFNARIQIYSTSGENAITINQLGHFSTVQSYIISLGTIKYRFVLLLGQGRFYYTKMS